eukprot:177840-Ditylum_brightwellii.AAC.1
MITFNINSELPSSKDEHTKVSASNKSDSKQSSNRPSTTPTGEPPASAVHDELLLMMQKMENSLKRDTQDIQERQQRQAHRLTDYISELSTKVISNTESLKKVESNLNVVTQTVSKFKIKLVIQKEIYFTHQKDINKCITDIASNDLSNKVNYSCFEEKLSKAIHDTKQ